MVSQEVITAAWQLLRPSSLLVLALVVGIVAVTLGRRRIGLLLLWSTGLVLLAATVLPIGQWALAPLENRFPPPVSPPEHVDGIILLGGAMVMSLSDAWHRPSLTDAAERMTDFVALARRYPDARLVFAGGAGTGLPGAMREADVARLFFDQMGVPSERVVYESESRSTWENAVFSYALTHPRPGEIWLLVTSAFHMPRAVGAFRKAGWEITPWPVGFKSGRYYRPLIGANLPKELHLLDDAAHEWVGGWSYRLLGRSL